MRAVEYNDLSQEIRQEFEAALEAVEHAYSLLKDLPYVEDARSALESLDDCLESLRSFV